MFHAKLNVLLKGKTYEWIRNIDFKVTCKR